MVMVYFIPVLKLDNVKGKSKEISISKIRNKIIIKKNCIEKEGIEDACVKNPHSKAFHFCKLVSDKTVIVLINVNNNIINRKFVKNDINTVIRY